MTRTEIQTARGLLLTVAISFSVFKAECELSSYLTVTPVRPAQAVTTSSVKKCVRRSQYGTLGVQPTLDWLALHPRTQPTQSGCNHCHADGHYAVCCVDSHSHDVISVQQRLLAG